MKIRYFDRVKKISSLIGFMSFLTLICSTPAFADLAFSSGTERLGNDIMNFLSPLAGIVIIGLGVGAWMGKVSWSWCISFVLGMILVFGHTQILSWLRSLFGF